MDLILCLLPSIHTTLVGFICSGLHVCAWRNPGGETMSACQEKGLLKFYISWKSELEDMVLQSFHTTLL
ncbi:hypothetical protein BVRB_3g048370 [Beta vulgaris subsp. vulgaris]|nr:hypothetical protein BVRB_3g048370 [Beta vulgaris subsp. vulgaris]